MMSSLKIKLMSYRLEYRGDYMTSILLKHNRYQLLLDLQQKQLIIYKRDIFHFLHKKKLIFEEINKIIFEFQEEMNFSFKIQTVNHKTYIFPFSLNKKNESDFIVFLIYLKNTTLYIEDKKNIINNILKNEM